MSLRITALIYMACFAALSMGVYMIKYSVQNIQREVVTLKADLDHEKESVHLLKAEWAYLNRPERLQQLAGRHLDLVPLDSKKIEEIGVLPAASHTDARAPENADMFLPISQTVEPAASAHDVDQSVEER